MSMYCEIQTEFKDMESLVLALYEMRPNWRDNIEYHNDAVPLYGYQGDIRKEKANVIIRRKHIGESSNDIGFIRENGVFKAIISEFDRRTMRFNNEWLARLKSEYVFQVINKQQRAKGRIVTREKLKNGKQRLTIKGIR